MGETKKVIQMPTVEAGPEKYEENKHKRLDISRTLRMELEEFSPQLQKVAKYLLKSEKYDPISDLCRLAGCSEKYVRADIEKYMKEGKDFLALILRIAGHLDRQKIPIIKQVLFDQAKKSKDHNACRTYLQAVGAFGNKPGENDAGTTLLPAPVGSKKKTKDIN